MVVLERNSWTIEGMDSTSKLDAEAATLFTSVSSTLAEQADKDVFAIGGTINIPMPLPRALTAKTLW